MSKKPTDEEVICMAREFLDYDLETGIMTWKKKPSSRVNVGDQAGSPDGHGYIRIKLLNWQYRFHRVAWAMVTGSFPAGEIDHINGLRVDNRWANLREVSSQENKKNLARSPKNTSGVTGVKWRPRPNKWESVLGINGKTKFLGQFETFDDAVAARRAAEARYGYHPNHGRAALKGAPHE